MLKKLGHEVFIAQNGKEAVEQYTLSQGKYDLVLMDIRMPELDGREAARKIRQIEKTRGLSAVPIIAMTANVMVGDRQKAKEAGMNDHIGKPFDLTELLNTMVYWIIPDEN